MTKSLDKIYDSGKQVVPGNGTYLVEMRFNGIWYPVLKKKIKGNRGTNHPPIFGLGWYSIPFGEFLVDSVNNESLFIYDNNRIIDRLKHVDYNRWLGKLYWVSADGEEIFLDWFYFTKV